MSIRHKRSQVQDSGELEQALTIAEDARDEAARLTRELDEARLLLAQREREILSLHAEMERRETEADARLREVEDNLLNRQRLIPLSQVSLDSEPPTEHDRGRWPFLTRSSHFSNGFRTKRTAPSSCLSAAGRMASFVLGAVGIGVTC